MRAEWRLAVAAGAMVLMAGPAAAGAPKKGGTLSFAVVAEPPTIDVLVEFISDFADDPTAQFDKLLTKKKSSQAASGHTDSKIDDLFEKQARAVDPAQRKVIANELERYALTQAYSIPLLWWQRIIVNHKKVQGWEHQANHFTASDLVNVWLDQ